MSNTKILISIAVIAAVTAAIRFLPFVLFKGRETPKLVRDIGKLLPYAVMAMLVIFCLRDISFAEASGFVPQLIGVFVVAVSYLILGNTLVSIVSGTVIYMLLVQLVF